MYEYGQSRTKSINDQWADGVDWIRRQRRKSTNKRCKVSSQIGMSR